MLYISQTYKCYRGKWILILYLEALYIYLHFCEKFLQHINHAFRYHKIGNHRLRNREKNISLVLYMSYSYMHWIWGHAILYMMWLSNANWSTGQHGWSACYFDQNQFISFYVFFITDTFPWALNQNLSI
jgi:hypothetical protein